MASVNSVSSSSYTSSLYNSANIISGLASGMDTESMIESLVQSYQNKIQTLTNNATKIEWKQEIYRSIISKMASFTSNYTSYTSSTNLLSSSFFTSAVKVTPQGENGSKVSATGRTDSNVVLNSVSQLATAARYVTSGSGLKADGGNKVTASEPVDLEDTITLSNLSGSLAFKYGNQTVSISFDQMNDTITGDDKAQQLKKMIEDKLADATITLSSGSTASAADRIGVELDAYGNFSFYDKSGAGNGVSISSASSSIKETLNLGDMSDTTNPLKGFRVTYDTEYTRDVTTYEYISGKSYNINVDGVTKTIRAPQIEKLDEPDADGNMYKLTMPSSVKDKNGNVSYVYDTSSLDKSKYTVTKQGETVYVKDADDIAGAYTGMLQSAVKDAFGNKLTVNNVSDDPTKLQLEFEVNDGSNLLINNDVGDTLGIGRAATNYLNTSNTLADLLKDGVLDSLDVAKDEEGWPLKDESTGKPLYDFKINGVLIGQYSEDTKLSTIMSDINANSEAGIKVSYSKTTREFVFNSKETGSDSRIDIEDGGLAAAIFGSPQTGDGTSASFADAYGAPGLKSSDKITVSIHDGAGDLHTELTGITAADSIEDVADKLNASLSTLGYAAAYNKYSGELEITDQNGKKVDFGMAVSDKYLGDVELTFDDAYKPDVSYTPGQDAKFTVTVNGTQIDMTRGTNTADIDGLSITFKETFDESDGGAVTFKTSTDSDKIVDAVKSMIADYNEMMAEIRSAYATMPYQDSSGAFKSYEPLSADDMATMSESAIQAYEAKAKQGILFGDSDLRSLYERMQSVFQRSGADATLLSQMGISVSFSSTDNSTTITLDENKLRDVLDNDPDSVADLFTRVGESGVSTNGIMQDMKVQLDRYAGLTGATKGILVQKAGTPLNSLSLLDNQWQKQIDNIGSQIEKWQDKLEAQVDRYTSMFSKLEVLINQMNSQSSTLASMMGG